MAKQTKPVTEESHFLTPRQLEIMTMIRDYRKQNGYAPTLQELGDAMGVSKITVFEHVEALLGKGVLIRSPYRARSLELTSLARFPDERPTVLPLVGRIAAGKPIEAVESSESVDMEAIFQSRYPVRVLCVTGDSMINDQICDGDYVVYEERTNAKNGDTVIALVNRDEATLKRFYKEKNRIRLQPANDKYQPIYVRDVAIQGVVIGVLRKLRRT
ncbi:MAG: transcriptional repressor LexA [Planctomycetota bacterium]